MVKKILVAVLFIAIIVLGYQYKDQFMDIIEAGGWLSVLVSILLYSICVFFPVVPVILLVGVIGAVFGTVLGTGISLAGALVGTSIMFLMTRYGFRTWAQGILDKYPKAKEYEGYFEKNAFLSIVAVRIVPVVPTQVVNILTGVSKVPWLIFFAATAIGALPRLLIFAFVGNSFEDNKLTSILTYAAYMVVIFIFTYIFMKRRMDAQQKK
ncbi:putative membrane protein YdjX (TVP38/TMEM64 family) [Tumebacillus sp. BK434]|uniref:TVP38/TMEM64 family protein n=1 Tax=Tumebacillus sp. BK434 TaxID=2512169 RepID=UPI0010D12E73|nr:TVP38/TMEM64 family protein [Tumebacillus sp. BK434]TCP58045.1 putative membrane protein YdjX (TVP38/TMEM64 family) [Tumebacillus sp. BK434]